MHYSNTILKNSLKSDEYYSTVKPNVTQLSIVGNVYINHTQKKSHWINQAFFIKRHIFEMPSGDKYGNFAETTLESYLLRRKSTGKLLMTTICVLSRLCTDKY